MDTLQVVDQRPCTDKWCWDNGRIEDCAGCQYAKNHPQVIVLDTDQEDVRHAA